MTACYVQNIKKIYPAKGEEKVALEDVSFEVEEGELFVITGPSRSGKTTLLSIIGGLLKPTSGTCEIHGTNLFELSDKEASEFRLRHIGYVFQKPTLINSYTIFENVIAPMYLIGMRAKDAKKRALEVLDQVGLIKQKDDYPKMLSEAEKSLTSIARSLALLPKVLIYDEPTSSLDHSASVKLLTFLKELAYDHDTTIISTITDVRLQPFANRVAKMKEGKIVMIVGETSSQESEPPFLKL